MPDFLDGNTGELTSAVEPKTHDNARTFIVRMWLEDLGDGRTEWRGRVQDVQTGKVTFFRDWERLATTIQEMLASGTSDIHDMLDDDGTTQSSEVNATHNP